MPELLIYNIYKIVNNLNDKIYIGSTRQKLCRRMTGHRADAKSSPKIIAKFMRDNGVKNFKIKLIKIIHVRNIKIAKIIEQIEIWSVPPELRLNSIRSHVPSKSYRGHKGTILKRASRRAHYARKKLDPEWVKKEKERNKLRMRKKRLDPIFLAKDRERSRKYEEKKRRALGVPVRNIKKTNKN